MTTVIRPTWTPSTDEQRRILAEGARRAERVTQLRALLAAEEEALWRVILAGRTADVPDTVLCERTGQSRATLNRRYGPRES